jgi:hypothetical protein
VGTTAVVSSADTADTRATLVATLQKQQIGCAGLGSEFYARLVGHLIDDVGVGGPVWDVLAPYAAAPFSDAYALRVLGGVHLRVLAGRAPELAAHYPSTGGDGDADAVWPAFRALLADGCPEVVDALRRPPQTNEVGRSASAIGGFLEVARATGLPLRVLEIGASAGLNLRFDRFRYEQGGAGFGPSDATLRFADCWPDGAPPFAVPMSVLERAGCDVDPIDVATDAGALTLCSYVWPDPPERMARLRAAIAVARAVPATLDRADAAEWLAARLAEPRPGVATVVFHSVMWQYLPEPTRTAIAGSLADSGLRATPDAPVAWLRLEPPLPAMTHTELRLTLWTGSATPVGLHLADAGFHLGPVHWHPNPDVRT